MCICVCLCVHVFVSLSSASSLTMSIKQREWYQCFGGGSKTSPPHTNWNSVHISVLTTLPFISFSLSSFSVCCSSTDPPPLFVYLHLLTLLSSRAMLCLLECTVWMASSPVTAILPSLLTLHAFNSQWLLTRPHLDPQARPCNSQIWTKNYVAWHCKRFFCLFVLVWTFSTGL